MTDFDPRTIAVRGGLAAVLAAVLNTGLAALTRSLELAPGMVHFQYPRVAVLTVIGVLAAALVLAVVARMRAEPGSTFFRVAAAALLLSFVPDLGVLANDPAATVPGVVVLMLMHVVAASVAVRVLIRGVGEAV